MFHGRSICIYTSSASVVDLRSPMAALEGVIQEYIEKRRHFVGSFDIGWLGLGQNHFDEFRCNLTDDNLAVRPVVFFQLAVFESQRNFIGFLVPAMDFKGFGILEHIVVK